MGFEKTIAYHAKSKSNRFKLLGIKEGRTYKMVYTRNLKEKDKTLPNQIMIDKIYHHHITYKSADGKGYTLGGSITKVDLLIGDYKLFPVSQPSTA